MKKRIDQALIFSPKPNATPDEIMEILRLFVFQSYPPELRTQKNLTTLYNQLPENARRHFQVKDPQ